ncbi:DUF115 domain-containing protein, partial [Klebsiella pneumoniae]|uniref:6-hydroxymethylpterin diphosphokinase MptE-like protein n=1 Tax=Klebsiella pneumoniae TaxID=573 RepID=UPI00226D5F0A
YFKRVPDHSNTVLIGCALLMNHAFNAWKGRTAIFMPTPAYGPALLPLHLGRIRAGHSAGNLNVAAASEMGFQNIILVGHDLALEKNSL